MDFLSSLIDIELTSSIAVINRMILVEYEIVSELNMDAIDKLNPN